MGVRYHFLVPIHWPKPWTHPRGPSFALVPLQTAAPRLRSGRRRCRPRRPSPPPRSPTRRSPPPSTPSAVAAAALADRRLRHTRLCTLPVRRRCTGPSTSLFHHRAARRVAYESFDRSHAAPPDPTVPGRSHRPSRDSTGIDRCISSHGRHGQCGSWSASGGGTGSSTNVVVVVIGGQLACPDLPLFN